MCTDAEAISLMRALVARQTGAPVTAPAVQTTADLLLRLAPVLTRLPPRYTGQVIIDYDRGVRRVRQTQDVPPGDIDNA